MAGALIGSASDRGDMNRHGGALAGPLLVAAGLLGLSTLFNVYTVLADRARLGVPLPAWEPWVWESSSHLLIFLLIPAVAWWLDRWPLDAGRRRWSALAHLLATVPFSLIHTGGMVLLRQVVYRLVGSRYDFGPFWSNWVYEYRKDFLVYGVILGALLALRLYRAQQPARERPHAGLAGPAPAAALESEPAPVPATAAGSRAAPEVWAGPLERLVVRKRNREFILAPADIDRLEADGNYVTVHAAGENYRLRDSLDSLARRLGEQRFARVHRGHLVNIDRIREIQPWDHGDYRIVLKDGSFVNFSRRYRSRLSHLFR